ncbi:MAG TPA: hypothetical protein VIF40_18625 [Methylosinus sp.]|uniref:hypothetical protein n=1 Tax=Methylosinus sp. TaxID=427 RepID=UPI002F95149D
MRRLVRIFAFLLVLQSLALGIGREAVAAHRAVMGGIAAAAGECRPQGRTAPAQPDPADCCLLCSLDRADKQAVLLAILAGRSQSPTPRAAAGFAARAEDGELCAPSRCAGSASARGPPPVSPPIERSRRGCMSRPL